MNTDILKSAIAAIKAELAKLEAELETMVHPVTAADPAPPPPPPPSGGGPGEEQR